MSGAIPKTEPWWTKLRLYLELIRFSHTLFALPFALLATLWSLVVPYPVRIDGPTGPVGWVRIGTMGIGIVLCMVFARSFAMGINRLADERWDGANPRTAKRHLPAGLLHRNSVRYFCSFCALCFAAACGLFLPNWIPLVCSVPVLVFLASYSWAKRFTYGVHFWLGVALMLAPICAWIAIRGDIVRVQPSDLFPSIMLGSVVLFWVAGFDIIYACQDVEFDRQHKLYSLPALLGITGAMRVAALSHCIMWGMAMSMTWLFPQLSLGWLFRSMLLVVAGLLVYEHSVVSAKSLDRIQLAFFHLNSIISVLFLTFGTVDAYLR